MKKKNSMSVQSVVAIGIGAALFFVLMRYVAIPSPIPNTNFGLQYCIAALIAVIYGPVAGLLVAFIGHMLTDMASGWGIWWSWVIASGVFGYIMGFAGKKLRLDEGVFDKSDMWTFVLWSVVAHAIAWGLVAPTLDIAIYSEPADKVYLQGLVGGVSNIISTAVVGSLLCMAYAKSKPQKGSLSKE